jgi:hypothetical protein
MGESVSDVSIFKLRTEIREISESLKNSSWLGESTIRISHNSSVPVAKLAEILTTSTSNYGNVEKCLQHRLSSVENLVSSLKHLCNRVNTLKPWYKRIFSGCFFGQTEGEKILLQLTTKIEAIISRWSDQIDESSSAKESEVLPQNTCEVYTEGKIKVEVTEHVEKTNQSLDQPIRQCAFRTLKNLNPSEEVLANTIGGSAGIYSMKTLVADCERFIELHLSDFSSSQKKLMEETLWALRQGENLAFGEQVVYGWNRVTDIDPSVQLSGKNVAIENHTFKVGELIRQLEVNQSLIIPGGCRDMTGGHMVVFEVSRRNEKEFSFAVFNTGEGCELGLKFDLVDAISFNWFNKVRVPIFANLPIDAVSNPKFLADLLPIHLIPSSDHTMKMIYDTINKHLASYCRAEKSRWEIDRQRWATCSFDSVLSFMQSKLGDLFPSFHLFMMKEARKKLDQILPVASGQGVFPKETIELIDRKSRSVIDSYGNDYQKYFQENFVHKFAKEVIDVEKISNKNDFFLYLKKRENRVDSSTPSVESDIPIEKDWLEVAMIEKIAAKSPNIIEHLLEKQREVSLFNKVLQSTKS